MNQTVANATPPISTDQVLTTSSLVLIAIFAVLVVIGILYGMRLRAQRRVAEQAEEAAIDETKADTTTVTASPRESTPAPPPPVQAPVQPPVAPPPPPLADEPIPAVTLPEANPAAEAQADATPVPDSAAAPADGPITQLKGLGPKVAARLAELGITRVGQIASLDPDAAEALDAQLGSFRGRMERDRWLEQARFLAAGDTKGFEAVFGRL